VIKLNSKKEATLVKYVLIVTVVIGVAWMLIDEGEDLPEHFQIQPYSVPDELIQVESGFGKIQLYNDESDPQSTEMGQAGLIYSDEDLGFKITKPNFDWDFNSNLDVVVQENSEQLLLNGFRGGVYIEQNNEKTFFVAVFDISNQEQFLLEDYVTTQTDYMTSKFDTQLTTRAVSPNNQWAIFGMKLNLEDRTSYGEQLLYIQNDMFYMLQYTGLPPDQLTAEQNEERREIIDSFSVNKI
jgi:hypothetical protein